MSDNTFSNLGGQLGLQITNSGALALSVQQVDESGVPSGGKFSYQLLKNASETGIPVLGIAGGEYVWTAEADDWAGASVYIEYLSLDRQTWYTLKDTNGADLALSSNSSKAIVISQGAVIRARVEGTPVNLNSVIGGI